MKKYILLFSIFCLSLSNSFAQLGVGLRGGLGFSATSQELVTGMGRSLGSAPTFGLLLNYDLDLHFSAGLEFNYTTFSETLKYDSTIYPQINVANPPAVSITPKVSYLQIPIFGRVTFGDKKYKAALSFGPYIGIGLNGSWTNGPTAYSTGGSYVLFDSLYTSSAIFKPGNLKRLDFGGQVGIGGQYQIGKSGVLFLEARLQLGFVDIYAKQTDKMRDATNSQANKTGYNKPFGSWRSANITIGYYHTFKIPKKKASSGPVKKAGKQKK